MGTLLRWCRQGQRAKAGAIGYVGLCVSVLGGAPKKREADRAGGNVQIYLKGGAAICPYNSLHAAQPGAINNAGNQKGVSTRREINRLAETGNPAHWRRRGISSTRGGGGID